MPTNIGEVFEPEKRLSKKENKKISRKISYP
jgi:hypothetical protein